MKPDTSSQHPLAQVALASKEVASTGHRGGPVEDARLPYPATIESNQFGDVVVKISVPCTMSPPQLMEASIALCDSGFTRFSYEQRKRNITTWTVRLIRAYPNVQVSSQFQEAY